MEQSVQRDLCPYRSAQYRPEAYPNVVLRRIGSRNLHPASGHCEQVYGSSELFAASKRQLSTREIKEFGLR
jgi:hypothetical protein